MYTQRVFLVLMAISTFVYAWAMLYVSEPFGYLFGILPHLVLLYYWFQQGGWNFRLFSISWVLFLLTDTSAFVHNSYSSVLTSILAILSLLFLILGFVSWKSGYAKRRGYLALFAVAYGFGYFFLIHESIPSHLLLPIAIYASLDAVIFIVVAGLRLKNSYSYILCLFGVSLFILADAVYAYHFFIEPMHFGEPYMGILHNLCRVLFVLGILEEYRSDNYDEKAHLTRMDLHQNRP